MKIKPPLKLPLFAMQLKLDVAKFLMDQIDPPINTNQYSIAVEDDKHYNVKNDTLYQIHIGT